MNCSVCKDSCAAPDACNAAEEGNPMHVHLIEPVLTPESLAEAATPAVRLLTGKEAAALSVEITEKHGGTPFSEWKLIQAVQRKFCEVNGLSVVTTVTQSEPK
jgi:hypothetical protein